MGQDVGSPGNGRIGRKGERTYGHCRLSVPSVNFFGICFGNPENLRYLCGMGIIGDIIRRDLNGTPRMEETSSVLYERCGHIETVLSGMYRDAPYQVNSYYGMYPYVIVSYGDGKPEFMSERIADSAGNVREGKICMRYMNPGTVLMSVSYNSEECGDFVNNPESVKRTGRRTARNI